MTGSLPCWKVLCQGRDTNAPETAHTSCGPGAGGHMVPVSALGREASEDQQSKAQQGAPPDPGMLLA